MKIYLTSYDNVHPLSDKLLKERLGGYEIQKNEFGKPYVRGNGVYFNLSHSGKFGVIALSETPVGVDVEAIKGRDHALLLNRFNAEERAEVNSEADFLVHFTAREAYVKYSGGSIYALYNKLSFEGGYIYLDGIKQENKITSYVCDGCVISVCGEGEIEIIEC